MFFAVTFSFNMKTVFKVIIPSVARHFTNTKGLKSHGQDTGFRAFMLVLPGFEPAIRHAFIRISLGDFATWLSM